MGVVVMRQRRVIWLRVSQPLVISVIVAFAALGLFLSLQRLQPVVAVAGAGGKIGFFLRMLLDMLEFVDLGI